MCDEVQAAVVSANAALDGLDVDRAQALLSAVRERFTCAAVPSPAVLAQYWLAEGRLAALNGAEAIARLDLEAARRLDPSLAVTGQGEPVESLFASSVGASDVVRVDLATPLGRAWTVSLDGAPVTAWPVEVPRGLHLVQIGDGAERTLFAKVMRVEPGAVARVDHGLPEAPPPPEPEPLRPEVSAYAGLSADFALGRPQAMQVEGVEHTEPAAKLLTPLEVGVVAVLGGAWASLGAQAGPLVGGEFVFGGPRVPDAWPYAWGVDVSAGKVLGDHQVGLLVGTRLPSRARLRAVGTFALGEQFALHAEAGVNAPTGRPLEPAVSVGLRYRGQL